MMKEIKVRIEDADWFPGLDKQAEFFIEILRKKYKVKILKEGNENPDLLFYTCYGGDNLKWTNCLRIYHTAERDYPNFNLCDYAIGLSDLGFKERFLHFPSYVYYNDILRKCEATLKDKIDKERALSRGFCSAVVSDPFRDPVFFQVFNKLNEYKKIDSGGRVNNTTGYRVPDKLNFISKYKFNLAFENMLAPGYVTEKIVDAFVAKTVPIYWGSDRIKEEFGVGGYININDFSSIDEAIEYIIEVDNNDELYLEILQKGPKLLHTYEEWCNILLEYLSEIIENGTRIFDARRNNHYSEKAVFYKIRNMPLMKLYRKWIRKKNSAKIYGKNDVGDLYENFD